MRVLFDQATPVPLRPFLQVHTVRTAAQEGWDELLSCRIFGTLRGGYSFWGVLRATLRFTLARGGGGMLAALPGELR
jgi:hypothetical protein